MFEFYQLKKLKIILVALNFTRYLAWSLFFIFQGRAIQLAMAIGTQLKCLVSTLVAFVLTKLIVMGCDLLSQYFMQHFENKEIKGQWQSTFPKKLYQDNEKKNNLMYLMYFDLLPGLFSLECAILNNQCTMVAVLLLLSAFLIYTGFYYPILGLGLVFFLTVLSKRIFLQKLTQAQQEIQDNKSKLLSWINQYFSAYREIFFNWPRQVQNWINMMPLALYQAKKRYLRAQVLRDLLAQVLVELPFLLNTTLMILAVYLQYLSVTQLFVWLGFSQLVINAANSLIENKANQGKRMVFITELLQIKNTFIASPERRLLCLERRKEQVKSLELRLLDNCCNYLSLKPALYPIRGKNGAGKTTLLNSILGYERQRFFDNQHNLFMLLKNISSANIRVIEREPEIFTLLLSFNEQILGPEQAKLGSWKKCLAKKMKRQLSADLLQALFSFFSGLEEKFYQRENHHLSSGEKVLISLLRALTSWNPAVFILVADECLAFLDLSAKSLVLRCLNELSRSIAIFISSHELISSQQFTQISECS